MNLTETAFTVGALLFATAAGITVYAACLAASALRHWRDTARTHARIARLAAHAIATGQAVLDLGPPQRPAPTDGGLTAEQLRAMYDASPGEDTDR